MLTLGESQNKQTTKIMLPMICFCEHYLVLVVVLLLRMERKLMLL